MESRHTVEGCGGLGCILGFAADFGHQVPESLKTDKAVLEGKVLLMPQQRGPGLESDEDPYWARSCHDIREVSEERGEGPGRRRVHRGRCHQAKMEEHRGNNE